MIRPRPRVVGLENPMIPNWTRRQAAGALISQSDKSRLVPDNLSMGAEGAGKRFNRRERERAAKGNFRRG